MGVGGGGGGGGERAKGRCSYCDVRLIPIGSLEQPVCGCASGRAGNRGGGLPISVVPSKVTTISALSALRESWVWPHSGERSSMVCSMVMGSSSRPSMLPRSSSSLRTGMNSPSTAGPRHRPPPHTTSSYSHCIRLTRAPQREYD